MPKIIENLEHRLMAEARRQIEESDYAATTIRSVAAGVGVGVGTVYNYFTSKDDLTAAYLLEDWSSCIAVIQDVSDGAEAVCTVLQSIFQQLRLFTQRHQKVFQNPEAVASFSRSYSRYHNLMRTQLSELLEKFYQDRFLAEFVAEAMLTWTIAGKEFEEIYRIVSRLF